MDETNATTPPEAEPSQDVNSTSSQDVNNASSEQPKKMTKKERAEFYKKTYPEPQCTWRQVLKDIWVESETEKEVRNELATSICYSIFEDAENPFRAALDLHTIMPDYSAAKEKSIAGFVVRALLGWLRKQDEPGLIFNNSMTQQMQLEALNVATERHTAHLRTFAELFAFNENAMPHVLNAVVERVRFLAERQSFKEALELADFFKLHDKFELELFLIPSILQDRSPQVIAYIKGHRILEQRLIDFLDSFVGLTDMDVEEKLKTYKERKIGGNSFNKFKGKTLEKYAVQVLSELGLKWEIAPRLKLGKHKSHIRWTIQNRDDVVDKVITKKIFDSLRQDVGEDRDMQVYVASQSYFLGFQVEAVMWAIYFNLEDKCLPYELQDKLRRQPWLLENGGAMVARLDVSTSSSEPLFLFPGYPVVWVDDRPSVEAMLSACEAHVILGIDSEFKPSSMTMNKQEVALLQVATPLAGYLVDFCALPNVLTIDEMTEFLKRLFHGPQYKIGFDMQSDLHAISSTIPFGEQVLAGMKNVICLKRLVNEILEVNETIVDISDCTSNRQRAEARARKLGQDEHLVELEASTSFKLSDLVEILLYETLDKSQQMSNWAVRPLTLEQLVYAVKDAYVLLELYDEIQHRAKGAGLDLESIVSSIVNELGDKKRDKRPKKSRLTDEEYAEIVEEVNRKTVNSEHAKNKSFIADTMLNGIGRHLRRLGVDVLFATPELPAKVIAKQHPFRIILTLGKSFDALRPLFPNRVFSVPTGAETTLINQVKFVLLKFNMEMQRSDVFSRCMECNSKGFVLAPSPVLQALHDYASKNGEGTFDDEPFDLQKWIDLINEASPEKYDGVQCKVTTVDEQRNTALVECKDGFIDILRGVVVNESSATPIEVAIQKVQPEVIARPFIFYFVCKDCGKVYWNGSHGVRYAETATDLLNSSQRELEVSI